MRTKRRGKSRDRVYWSNLVGQETQETGKLGILAPGRLTANITASISTKDTGRIESGSSTDAGKLRVGECSREKR